MKIRATIDNVALAALIFAVVAIAAVSTIAIVAAEQLISTNERILQTQRVIASLEAIRFQSLALDVGEQSFVITGNERDLGPYRSGAVEIDADLTYLAGKRGDYPMLAERFPDLDRAAKNFIASERKIVDARRTTGFKAAQSLVKSHVDEALHEKLLGATYQLLTYARRLQDGLEAEQVAYGDKVRRLIFALISSSAFILFFLYGTLRRLNLEQRAAQQRIAHQATHDSLTDLFNRHAVMEHISARLQDAETEAALGGFGLLLLDLDGFKEVNDSLGHDAGDDLLREVARRAKAALRDSDYIARLGGDEFLVVIPQVSDIATADRIAQKMVDVIGKPYRLGARTAQVTTSIGISLFPQDARNRETLMKYADLALYEAKHAGRNRAFFFKPGMRGGTRN